MLTASRIVTAVAPSDAGPINQTKREATTMMITTQPHMPTSALLRDHPHRQTSRSPRRGRRPLRVLLYLLAFLLPPLLVGAWSIYTILSPPAVAGALDAPPPTPPAHDEEKLTAVMVAGVNGAESIDTLVPYQLLAESGRFNVYTVAPRREPVPLFPASPHLQGVELLPHFSLEDYDEQVGVRPDLIVVPWVPTDERNAPLHTWLRKHAGDDTTVLTICGGSWTAAQAGLLDGRSATSHDNVLPHLRSTHTEVDWLDGRRFVEDGDVVSSAGITAAFDATLKVLERRVGRDVAEDVAARVGYPHLGFIDDPTYQVPARDRTLGPLTMAYGRREAVGVAVYDAVGEIELASILDVHPRTNRSVIEPIGTTPVVTTRHGLHLVPRHRVEEPAPVARLLVPGDPGGAAAAFTGWAEEAGVPVSFVHGRGVFAIDAALADVAAAESRAVAAVVARGIEYPVDLGRLEGRAWPHDLAVRPIALGLLGLLAAVAASRLRRANLRGAV